MGTIRENAKSKEEKTSVDKQIIKPTNAVRQELETLFHNISYHKKVKGQTYTGS